MSTLSALIAFAAETAEHGSGHDSDKSAFYIAGAVLAVWAVLVSVVGIKKHGSDWPSKAVATGIMGLTALLVVATAATSILTS